MDRFPEWFVLARELEMATSVHPLYLDELLRLSRLVPMTILVSAFGRAPGAEVGSGTQGLVGFKRAQGSFSMTTAKSLPLPHAD